jgi:hypothetical protein
VSATPNLAVEHILQSQAQKEVTAARQIIYGAMIVMMMLVYGRGRRAEGQ